MKRQDYGIFAYDKNVTPYIQTSNIANNTAKQGIYIASVTDKTAAQRAGIKEGDILLSIDDNNLERMCELRRYIYTKKPKDEVVLKIQRNSRELEIKVKLDKK